MKTKGKPWQFFVVAVLIVVFAFTAFLGISTQYGDTTKIWVKGAQDIRFGIDIRGGVDVTFMPADGYDATDEQMAAAESVIQQRLVNLNITDNEVYTDYNKDRIIVRFPWKEGETDFNPESAIQEIGATAVLTFREGKEVDSEGKPTGVTAENIILEGKDIKSATAAVDNNANSATYGQYYVSLELNDSGKESFAEATTRLSESKGTISIWMDDTMISYPTVNSAITDGNAMITLNGSDDKTRDEAISLANKINSGALPFALTAENYSTISPSLGANSLQAMVIAGVVAFVLVALFMIANYRLPGKARTVGEMLAEARQQSGAQKLAGHDIMALERFAPDTRHMIVFDVLSHESPMGWKGEKMRLFLTEAGYGKALENQEKGFIKIRNHAKVRSGHLHYDHKDREL